MMINFLSGTMIIKSGSPRKYKLRINFCPLYGIHQDGRIGVFLRTRKNRQKSCGSNKWLF